MRMCRRLALRSGGGVFGEDAFSYTGECLFFAEDNGNWRLKLLTSGVLTLLRKTKVDIFAVGGGGGGGNGNDGSYGGQGGGGYTATVKAQSLAKNVPYTVTIGPGGAGGAGGGGNGNKFRMDGLPGETNTGGGGGGGGGHNAGGAGGSGIVILRSAR